jgi:hypothetical protein
MSIWRLALAVTLLAGCASSGEEKTAHQMDNQAKERAFMFNGGDSLQARASYDLHCPAQAMECTVLQRAGMFAIAVAAGVRGCGLQATYMRTAGTGGAWVLNGGVVQDPTQMQQPPPPPAQ